MGKRWLACLENIYCKCSIYPFFSNLTFWLFQRSSPGGGKPKWWMKSRGEVGRWGGQKCEDTMYIYICIYIHNMYKCTAVGSFFMVRWLNRIVSHQGWPTTKSFKIAPTKTPLKQAQKTEFRAENKWFKISYLEFTY